MAMSSPAENAHLDSALGERYSKVRKMTPIEETLKETNPIRSMVLFPPFLYP